MALPRIVVRGKEIILLSGFKDEAKATNDIRLRRSRGRRGQAAASRQAGS